MAEPPLTDEEFAARARRLRWLVLDVDGVLTDGRLYYGAQGFALKAFDTRDGLGLKLAQQAGLGVATMSGRDDAALERRSAELGLDRVMSGVWDKAEAFDRFLAEEGLDPGEVAAVGDDLSELPLLARAGLSFAPADADPVVRRRVHVVLERKGGRGAAREMVERILRARGEWEAVVAALFGVDPVPQR